MPELQSDKIKFRHIRFVSKYFTILHFIISVKIFISQLERFSGPLPQRLNSGVFSAFLRISSIAYPVGSFFATLITLNGGAGNVFSATRSLGQWEKLNEKL